MPKLVHKDKVERRKSFNYTQHHDKLSKLIQNMKDEDITIGSPKELLKEADYSQIGNAMAQKGVKEIVREAWPVEDRAKKLKSVANQAELAEQYGNVIKAIEVANKMDGSIAALEIKTEVSGTIIHDIHHDDGDYANYLKSKINTREIVDGEVVDLTIESKA